MQGTDTSEIIALVDKSLEGERSAQFQLYSRYSKAMFNTCMRMLNDYGEAEDLLQDSFCDAFRKLSTYKREVAFGAWLKRIVVNNCINHLKRRRLDVTSLDKLAADRMGEMGVSPDPNIGQAGGSYQEDYDVERVQKAVEALPEGYRVVFNLYLVEGYDHQEISQILGISESTSKSQFHRAKGKVKAIVKAMNS